MGSPRLRVAEAAKILACGCRRLHQTQMSRMGRSCCSLVVRLPWLPAPAKELGQQRGHCQAHLGSFMRKPSISSLSDDTLARLGSTFLVGVSLLLSRHWAEQIV